jgi:hypothetical protein
MVPSFPFMFGRNLEGIPLPAYELLFKPDSRKCKTEPIYFCLARDTIDLSQGSEEYYDTFTELYPDAKRIQLAGIYGTCNTKLLQEMCQWVVQVYRKGLVQGIYLRSSESKCLTIAVPFA